MLNKYRQFDILLFHTAKDFAIGDIVINPGWNQMIRKDDFYFIRNISFSHFYAQLPTSLGHILAQQLFKQE